MSARAANLIARAQPDHLPVVDLRETVCVAIASLALGGAERIVLDWLAAEAAAGRACELAVLHQRRHARQVPPGVVMLLRQAEAPAAFMQRLGRRWADRHAPISTHLIGDDLLAILWHTGVRTVPVVHNAREGWRNDPRRWQPPQVPQAIACAAAVAQQMRAHGCSVPLLALRHRPRLRDLAFDAGERQRIRGELKLGPSTLLVLAVGALKPQKDYRRAIEVLRHLLRQRDAVLVIAGGVLDDDGLSELDRVVDAACAAGLSEHLRLPGFVDPIEPYYAATDVLLNVSRYEGLSMAVREALAAGLPVVASAVGGQAEIDDAGLHLLPRCAPAAAVAALLGQQCVRDTPAPRATPSLPRSWSLTLACHRAHRHDTDTLFVTANLNAGGAQRSLLNLASCLFGRHRFAVAVCEAGTSTAFGLALIAAGVPAFRPAATAEPLALAEALLAWASGHGVTNICLWNVDPRVKLLLARFAPPALRLIDVSPGQYAFEELEAAASWGAALDIAAPDYYARLDTLVLKYHHAVAPAAVRTLVIPNGVAARAMQAAMPAHPRFLVSGRIAPSKRLETILDAWHPVHARYRDARLHIVGTAEPRHADYAQALTVQAADSGVIFRGALPALEYLLEPFTAAVVLGTHQGSPNAVLEAMSAGIAVIANASGGSGEIVHAGDTGWLLAEDCDAAALAQAMLEAIADPLRTRRMASAGRAFVARHHTIAAMVERYAALLDAGCRGSTGRSGFSAAQAAKMLA